MKITELITKVYSSMLLTIFISKEMRDFFIQFKKNYKLPPDISVHSSRWRAAWVSGERIHLILEIIYTLCIIHFRKDTEHQSQNPGHMKLLQLRYSDDLSCKIRGCHCHQWWPHHHNFLNIIFLYFWIWEFIFTWITVLVIHTEGFIINTTTMKKVHCSFPPSSSFSPWFSQKLWSLSAFTVTPTESETLLTLRALITICP